MRWATTPEAKLDIDRELSRRRLIDFVRLGWPVLEPGMPYTHGKVLEAICEHLEAVTAGEIRRLLINVPPGMAKSMLTSVFWPMWEWGPRKRPEQRFLSFSYSDRLSIRDNRRSRLLVGSQWYQDRWPIALVDDQNQKTLFENDRRGWRMASSVGGVSTGARGSTVLIDDPHSVMDAESQAKREDALLWFAEALPTRLNDPERSPIVVIMQRIHERDVSGEIMRKELGYETLILPMEYEPDRHCATSIGWHDWRKRDGELLFPERFPAEVVERDKKTMGSYATAGQFQQRPAPRGGGMIKVERIPVVDDWPRDARMLRRWDLAGTESNAGGDPDWTAGALLAFKDGKATIVDIKRARLSSGGVQALVRQTAALDGYGVHVKIPQDPGSAGKQVAEHYLQHVLTGYTATAAPESGSKVQRAEPFAAAVEAGNVAMMRGEWNQAFLDEARTFPFGGHDDQIDAVADAFITLARQPGFFYAGLA